MRETTYILLCCFGVFVHPSYLRVDPVSGFKERRALIAPGSLDNAELGMPHAQMLTFITAGSFDVEASQSRAGGCCCCCRR